MIYKTTSPSKPNDKSYWEEESKMEFYFRCAVSISKPNITLWFDQYMACRGIPVDLENAFSNREHASLLSFWSLIPPGLSIGIHGEEITRKLLKKISLSLLISFEHAVIMQNKFTVE